MYLLRRTALKVFSSPSTSFVVKPRTITTRTVKAFRPQPVWIASPLQRRFASDDAAKPSEETTETVTESPSKPEAETITEQASAGISSAAEKVSDAAQAGAAALRNAATDKPVGAAAASGEKNPVLYVGNLFFEVTEAQLEQAFSKFGPLVRTQIIYDPRGLSKGFGYVEFINQADADKAVTESNQQILEGRRMAVQYHKPRQPRTPARGQQGTGQPSKTLFIGNMSFEMSDKDLNDLFREIRNVLDVRVAIDRRSGQPRGFAHADFIDIPSAQKAMEVLKDKEIYGRRLRVDFSQSSSRVRQE